MIKRYLLFAGSTYYPGGGWYDFLDSFSTIKEAKDFLSTHPGKDWFQIIDTHNPLKAEDV